jgi:hypothetical protein
LMMNWEERDILGLLLCICEGVCIIGGGVIGFNFGGLGGAILAGIAGILAGLLLWLLVALLWRGAFRLLPYVLILCAIILLIRALWGVGRAI